MTAPPLTPDCADALLFDLGRVVIDLDFSATLEHWAGHAGCAPEHLLARFRRGEVYQRHERGEIGDAAFFAGLRADFGVEISDAELLQGWNAIFVGESEGIDLLLARAAKRLPLYALSNTNNAHAEHFTPRFANVLRHFREIFLSSAIGARKPDAAAYDHVVAAIGVPAERIVFFDDLADNIAGAQARGLIGVQVRSSADVAAALDALGL